MLMVIVYIRRILESYQVSKIPKLTLNTGEEESTKSSEKLISYTLIELNE